MAQQQSHISHVVQNFWVYIHIHIQEARAIIEFIFQVSSRIKILDFTFTCCQLVCQLSTEKIDRQRSLIEGFYVRLVLTILSRCSGDRPESIHRHRALSRDHLVVPNRRIAHFRRTRRVRAREPLKGIHERNRGPLRSPRRRDPICRLRSATVGRCTMQNASMCQPANSI